MRELARVITVHVDSSPVHLVRTVFSVPDIFSVFGERDTDGVSIAPTEKLSLLPYPALSRRYFVEWEAADLG
jgi:hypothetical protein